MKTMYVAEDGTQFWSEEECLDYEYAEKCRKWGPYIRGLDAGGDLLGFDTPGFIHKVSAIYCGTDEAAKVVIETGECNDFQTDGIEGTGIYVWDTGFACWVSLRDKMAEINQELDELKDIAKKFRS